MGKLQLPKIIVVVGPTASGKTALAEDLARIFNGELVNADARQIYLEMDIATNKTLASDIPQHCFDLISPDQVFSVAEYQKQAVCAITEILARGNVPIIVGGTGLYVRALLENYLPPSVAPDQSLRTALEERSLSDLLIELDLRDPKTGAWIARANKRRVIRALEVVISTGQSFVELQKKGTLRYDAFVIGLSLASEVLTERIRKRLELQMRAGLAQEAQRLFSRYPGSRSALSSLGYPEMREYLEGRRSLPEAQERIFRNTLKYAKRQMTWFKKMPDIHWLSDTQAALNLVRIFLWGTTSSV